MLLLLDIGNTHTHVGLAAGRGRLRRFELSTPGWADGSTAAALRRAVGRAPLQAAALCSVVPAATERAAAAIRELWRLEPFVLTHRTVRGVGLDYPRPATIGPDRLANAVAARQRFGAPVVVVDFGTAVTFDVVNARGDYIGGIIAPGLAVMTEYLHEKTALLPRICLRAPRSIIGRSTREAMLAGAVIGYRGLIRELLREVRRALGAQRLPVVATGGYAALLARQVPEITTVAPELTLDGLRRVWAAHHAASNPAATPS